MKSKTLEEVRAEAKSIKDGWKKERHKLDWYGLVYCRNWASVSDENSNPIWLGKSNEIIPFFKERGFDGNNVDVAIVLAKEFEELKNNAVESPQRALRGSRKGVK